MKREDIEKAAEECRLTTAQSMGVYGQYHSIDECPEHGLSCDELVEGSFIKVQNGALIACGMMQARCQRSTGFASISLKTAPMDADIITKKIIAFGIHDLRILSNGLIFKI